MKKIDLDKDFEKRIRELRLWHWQRALENRNWADNYRLSSTYTACAKYNDEQANRHIKYVQYLNDFFPVGDNAEDDNAKIED